MNALTRFKFFLWYFGRFKVPLIGSAKPKLINLTDEDIIVKIKLRRKTKNHLNSMYFGAIAIGADIAGGLHGFYHIHKAHVKASILFKSFEAKFLSRPESDVYFVCTEGLLVKQVIESSIKQNKRINQPLTIDAYTMYEDNDQKAKVAELKLELSIKVLTN